MSTLFVLSTVSFATTPDISASTTTVSCNDSAINTNNAPANLEINWEPNTINLHWYNGNTELTVPTTSQSCTYDGALIPPPPLEREGYTFRGWRVRDIPYGYTRLDYIESTGTQWINTGIMADINIMAEFDFEPTKDSFTRFGVIVGSQVNYQMLVTRKTTANSYYSSLYDSSVGNVVVSFNIKGRLKCKANDNEHKVWINGENVGTLKIKEPRTERDIAFFAFPTGASTCIGRLFAVKLTNTNTNTVVGNFIPVKRNSDNVVGMYDTVTKTFFTNAGTGVFTAGPVAQ